MLTFATLMLLVIKRRAIAAYAALLVPLLVAAHLMMPGALGSLRSTFFPWGGLIAQQSSSAGSESSAGRVADLGPALHELSAQPLFGYGIGTRVVTGPFANAPILDNQWLRISWTSACWG